MRPLVWLADTEADTCRLGRALAAVLPEPAVVALDGPLGAGKTRLVQAMAAGLGIDPLEVTSPTFVLLGQYGTGRPLNHFDAYRLEGEEDFWELGPEEYYASGVTVIEWARRVQRCLPAERLEIEIEVVGETARRFELRGIGAAYVRAVGELAGWGRGDAET